MELENKVALVTGAGTTGGIGFHIAQALIAEGAEVLITGRDRQRGERAARTLGGRTRFIRADLNNPHEVNALAGSADHVDILVNNAAAFTADPTIEQDAITFDELISVNVRAPYFLTAAIAPKMLVRGRGSIINVSSMVAQLGTPGTSIYAATKAALESLTRTWAAEFAEAGIRVNTITPGAVRTEKVISMIGDATEDLGKSTLMGRIGEPREIAQVVLFLASDRASYITGTNITVNGGRTTI